jgi:hypothetical protein
MANYTPFESTAEFVIWLMVVGPSLVAFLCIFIKGFRESFRNHG